MSAESPRQEATGSNDADDKDSSVECPTCGREDFASPRGMKQHHATAHGESISGVPYDCDWCGKEIRIEPRRKERSTYITCSRECAGNIRSKHYSGKNHGSWKGGKVEVNCVACGDSIKIPPNRFENHDRFYCGRECVSGSSKPWNTGEDHPRWTDAVTLECEQCGGEIKTTPALAERKRFCSKECELEWRSEDFSGEGNPAWKGGYKKYYGPSWTTQRNKARERDGYECQYCQKEESSIEGQHHVHHIIPFRKFDDENEANKLSNLVTLCESCHTKWEGLSLRPDVR